MTAKQVLIFTECNTSGLTWSRGLGTYQIASHLRELGYSVQVIDFLGYLSREEIFRAIDLYVDQETLAVCFSISFFNPSTREIYFNTDDSSENQLRLISERQRLIEETERDGLPIFIWPFDLDLFEEVLAYVRAKSERIKTVLGGAPVERITLDERALAEVDRYFDYFVGGYGEEAIGKLLANLCNGDSNDPMPRIQYFDKDSRAYDFPNSRLKWDTSDAIFHGEVLPIEIARGCIFKCKFCSFPMNGKTSLDHIKRPEVLRNELMENFERFGTTNYMFCDDTFNDSQYKLDVLYEEVVAKLPFSINFFAYLRLDLIHRNPRQIELLKALGIRYAKFGIESLNDETIRLIGKGFSFAEIEETLAALKRSWGKDVIVDGSFIFGLPRETRASLHFMRDWLANEGMEYFHSYSLFPLFLRRLKPDVLSRMTPQQRNQLSDLSVNHEKYGYQFDANDGRGGWWRSDIGMGFDDMFEMVKQVYAAIDKHPNLRVGQHTGMAMHNLDITFEEVMRLSRDELLNQLKISERYLDKIRSYKEKVIGPK